MAIIYSPNEWIKPETKNYEFVDPLLGDLQDKIEAVALTVGEMTSRDIILYSPSRSDIVAAKTYINGLYKEEGALFALEKHLHTDAALYTFDRILPLVKGKKIWWRIKPQFLEHEGYWYTRMRIGILDG